VACEVAVGPIKTKISGRHFFDDNHDELYYKFLNYMTNVPNGQPPMKSQEKTDVSYSKKRIFRAMAMTAPNQGGTALGHLGFTLVELIVVCAILGVLAAMAIPQYAKFKDLAKIAGSKSEIRTVEKSIIAYNLDNATYPTLLDSTVTTTLKDPWGRDYQYYKITGGAGTPYMNIDGITPINTDFDLYSTGVDGVTTAVLDPISTSMDDIVRGADGAIVTLAKDY
jgi:general secretion pathway protein G